ncbi:MAG: hypothetical protein GXW99_11340 [Clostridiales bacterium]|nr:hypothetical protein [Clostridiales bacterium]
MTNQEKESKKHQKKLKKKSKDRQATGLGIGACVGFVGLAALAVAGHIVWGAVAMAAITLVGWLIAFFTDPHKKAQKK